MKSKIALCLRLIAAAILLQTLFFKFTGALESKFIFSTLGMEPTGRIASGVAELLAAVLLLLPTTQIYGAILTLGIISGAILSHVFVLGIVVQDDGGLLFALACAVFFSSVGILAIQREKVRNLVERFKVGIK